MEMWFAIETSELEPTEVSVDMEPATTAAKLTRSLAEFLRTDDRVEWVLYVRRLDRTLDPDESVMAAGVCFGDRLLLVEPRKAQRFGPPGKRREAAFDLVVVGGPAAGQRVALPPGDHSVGRTTDCDVCVEDPALSRRHFSVSVAPAGDIVITDLNSANGTFLDGKELVGPTLISIDSIVEAGRSLIRVVPAGIAAMPNGREGQIRFNRPPRVRRPARKRQIVVPTPPARADKPRLPWITALAPLAAGAGLVVTMKGQNDNWWIGLIAMGISPIIAVASYVEDRRHGRIAFRRNSAEWRTKLTAASETAARELAEEIDERRTSAPDAADLLDRANYTRSSLWERRPTDNDFLVLAAGWADQPATLTFQFDHGGGADNLCAEGEEAICRWTTATNVPVEISLQAVGAIGLAGERLAVEASSRALLLQLATLHSPRDVVLAVAVGTDERTAWEWLNWLPHLRSDSSPLSTAHFAAGDANGSALIDSASGLVLARRAEREGRLGNSRTLPIVVLVLSSRLRVPRASIMTILEEGPAVGVFTVWVGEDPSDLPGECGATILCAHPGSTSRVTFPTEGHTLEPVLIDGVSLERCLDAARAMAPVVDVTQGGARGQIPQTVSLLDLVGLHDPRPQLITQRWATWDGSLGAPIGATAAGAYSLDLRYDGPHALLGGTTGAGKSELLQSYVASLAVTHPPSRITFLLVDYKGGAAFKDAVHLPHTVGFVTDLDGHLVNRALTSLHAELRFREHLLRDHGVRDLIEMERRFPDAAPPSLVLVVDEFATLAKELPDFVDGVVSIAQRGRSLGIHLILATQRPAGAINDNIRANTNLRIALRMNDEADSQDIINSKDSALLSRSLPGRAFVRTGQSELTEVQIAYVGGNSLSVLSNDDIELVVSALRGPGRSRSPVSVAPDPHRRTDLQILVEAARSAAELENLKPPRPPWLVPLPTRVPLESLLNLNLSPLSIPIGLLDIPSEQKQVVHHWDVEQDGHLLVLGSSGSGKTTLLRAVAAALTSLNPVERLSIYGMDYATGGLMSLGGFPHCGGIMGADDLERVQRLIRFLEEEAGRRKTQFSEVGVATLAEYQRTNPGADAPRIVVFLDGFSGFSAVFERIDYGDWLDRLASVVSESRPLGIHWVISADRQNSVPPSLIAAMPAKVVFRLSGDDYSSVGLPANTARGVALPPGRGFTSDGLEVQAALVGNDPAGDGQTAAMVALATRLRNDYPTSGVRRIDSLPRDVERASMPVADPLVAHIGIAQSDFAAYRLDLSFGHAFVGGPPRSGKSTALQTAAESLVNSTPGLSAILFAPRRTILTECDFWLRVARGLAECDELAAELADTVDERNEESAPLLIVIDDSTELADSDAENSLEQLSRRGRDLNIRIIASAESSAARRAFSPLLADIRRDRSGILLRPDADLDGDLLTISKIPKHGPAFWVAGRAVATTDGVVDLVQVAH